MSTQIEASVQSIDETALEVERNLLSIFLNYQEIFFDYQDRIHTSYFASPAHALLFELINELVAQDADLDYKTLDTKIKDLGFSDTLPPDFILPLYTNPPGSYSVNYLFDRFVHYSQLRSLTQIGSELYNKSLDQKTNTGNLIADIQDKLDKVASTNQQVKISDIAAPNLLHETLKTLKERADQSDKGVLGISTGFTILDVLTNGLKPGELIIVAGRPASGKSTFAMNICEYAGFIDKDFKKPVIVFTLEMPYNQVLLRSIARLGTINQKNIANYELKPEDWQRLAAAAKLINDANNVYIDDSSYGLTIEKVRARVRQIAQEHINPETNEPEVGIVMVDYLQLLEAEQNFRDRHLLIAHIAKSLKSIAREFKCPVIALSQLNRNVDTRGPDARPTNADLRESGAIEQDADIVIMVHRPETNAPKEQKDALRGKAEIIITKNRQGEIGTIFCKFEGQYSRFVDDETSTYITG